LVRAEELRKILVELGPVCNAGYYFSRAELFFFNFCIFVFLNFAISGLSNGVMAKVIDVIDLFILPD